jgi:undecaprenyl diphosphate synthase
MKKIPTHVAIIMDGNGRWATARHLPRSAGHKEGAAIVQQVIEHAVKRKIKYLTFFAFSLDNLVRPKREIDALMKLLTSYLQEHIDELCEKGIRLHVIGDRSRIHKKLNDELTKAETKTRENKRITVTMALYYTGKWDIVQAASRLVKAVLQGSLPETAVDEATFENALSTATLPPVDLLIRTSGEARISNFLLWQCAYAEFYFVKTLWPDFTSVTFDHALESFAKRKRRFGYIDESRPQ